MRGEGGIISRLILLTMLG